jgi:hypothetical protein
MSNRPPEETASGPAEPEIPLAGGNMGAVVRVGSTVRRPVGEWTPRVHALLRHLRSAGVTTVPGVHGIDDRNREVLDYVEGDVPQYPMPDWVWSDAVLIDAAGALRRIHDATVGFDPSGPWRSPAHEPAEVICLNDVAPYNMVFRGGSLVSLIDVDFASPGPRCWDLAYLAYRLVPLSDEPGGPQSPEERRRRTRLLLDAYGCSIGSAEPIRVAELLDIAAARLDELAAFSSARAVDAGRAELHRHAVLYLRDAARLRAAAAESRE